ncbi:hypothetical protein [Qipengyuania spongiae]|uniref:ANTAR domain-containing protein n=1 Tax=Qipengyuania spongiae TaxID=2909673 RepID=A0ABY5SXH2_9SPHN|nr:hypothetical protein [Qipengyuania spongiae]UVI39242.1 hypothetical protein L1F33_13580 [Qipengyuania spongiae]
MMDRTHDDIGLRVRSIVDDAIAELLLLGMESADHAAELMACRAIVRIKQPEKIAKVADYAESFIERDQPGRGR